MCVLHDVRADTGSDAVIKACIEGRIVGLIRGKSGMIIQTPGDMRRSNGHPSRSLWRNRLVIVLRCLGTFLLQPQPTTDS